MKRILIVGAGFGGLGVAKALASTLRASDETEVVLLEKSKYFYHAIGAPRGYVDAEYTNKLFIPYDKAIPGTSVNWIRAVVTAIKAETNEIEYQAINEDDQPATKTETLSFDYLVLATGSSYTVPIKEDPHNFAPDFTKQQLTQVQKQITNAESILIVGGGGVGCEVAGEIASYFPDKKITLLHSRDRLCSSNNLTHKFHEYAMYSLDKLNVNVVLGERLMHRLTANTFERRVLTTDKSTAIESDVQLLCGGYHPLSEMVAAMDASLVDDTGSVRVNASLQLDDSKYSHIFAVGDVTNHPTPKSAGAAYHHGQFVAKELVALVRNKEHKVTRVFPSRTTEGMSLSLGPNGGVTQLPVFSGIVFGDMLTRFFKSGDLYASRMWRMLNAQAPER
ncbi:hypothetical protein Poli38472_003475 [Pythium oligandrum]|uniref:FAD/NAD(P)-binding domain-containing protein n=1 Tax=Pythium oligandrum TaxID=41045 RepID=A0A8K1C6W2_PYTOL|nr:hypothetical protein Poli38472_003475 [Pythium oligandrum]|eukprot:TMW57550.1 hypothetical protein Poli38472_003475 [Pythium oligandrum]